MRIDILCSSPDHPVNAWLVEWAKKHTPVHTVCLLRDNNELTGGDILFLISCTEIINGSTRRKYRHCFVLHASDLPQGRGWSPHIWAILEGATELTVSLLEAEDKVDSGRIWAKYSIPVPPDTLFDEINALIFKAELALMDEALTLVAADHMPKEQRTEGATYYPRRRPKDSEIDPSQPLAQSFNLLRVADPKRYPAFFRLHGATYRIHIEKLK